MMAEFRLRQGRTETTRAINWISGISRERESNQSSQLANPRGFFTAEV